MPWAAIAPFIPSIIGAAGGIGSSYINRPPKQEQAQRMRQFHGGPKIEELLYHLLMTKMARQSMFRPSMLDPRMRMMLQQGTGFDSSQMGAPSRGFITGGK